MARAAGAILVAAVLAAWSWPLPALVLGWEGAVTAHPLRGGGGAEGLELAWRLWSTEEGGSAFVNQTGVGSQLADASSSRAGTGSIRTGTGDPALYVGDGEHGALWRLAATPVVAGLGAVRSAAAVTLGLLFLSGLLAFRCARACRLPGRESALAAVVWLASPALLERGLTSTAGLAPPTVPAAALLAAALVTLQRPLGSSLLLGLVGAAATWIGAATAVGTFLAAAAGAWLARGRGPRVVGGSAVVALGLSTALILQLAGALSVEGLKRSAVESAGVEVTTEAAEGRLATGQPAAVAGRPLAGPSPFHPGVRRFGGSDSLIARQAAPAVGLVAVVVCAGLVLRRGRLRVPAVAALGILAVATAGHVPAMEQVLLPVGVLAVALLVAHAVAAMRRPLLATATVLAVAFEALVVPWPTARWNPPASLGVLAASPVPGGVLDLSSLSDRRAAMGRQIVHGRSTTPPVWSTAQSPAVAELIRRAPNVVRLALGAVDTEPYLLAAELKWLGIGHVLADTETTNPVLSEVLDDLDGWERAPDDGAVLWWYRTTGLWSAPPLAQPSMPVHVADRDA